MLPVLNTSACLLPEPQLSISGRHQSKIIRKIEDILLFFFFFQAEDGIRDYKVTGVQTCALPICMIADIFS